MLSVQCQYRNSILDGLLIIGLVEIAHQKTPEVSDLKPFGVAIILPVSPLSQVCMSSTGFSWHLRGALQNCA